MANFDRTNRDRENSDHDGRDYDGGADDEDNEGSHLPVVIIIAILVLAAFGGVVWLAYNQGVARGRSDVPVVRVAASTKGDDSGNKVYQQSAGPEEGDEAKTPQTAPAAAPPPAEVPGQETPVLPQPAPKIVTQAAPPPAVTPPAPKTQPLVAPPPTVPPRQIAGGPKPLPAKPVFQDTLPAQPQVATRPPAQLGAATPPSATPPKTGAVTPLTPVPLKPATLKPETPARGGSYLLQIGAFKSDAEARAAWNAYRGKHATLLNGFGPDVQKVDLGDKGTWYRLRIASFSDKDTAAAVCERLKSQGGACFLAK